MTAKSLVDILNVANGSKAKMDARNKLSEICLELNIDHETEEHAWTSFQNTKDVYTLEVSGAAVPYIRTRF